MEKKPRLVIFGDTSREHVSEGISDFIDFVDGKAEIVANCEIEACDIQLLTQSDYAVVFGGDGTIISAANELKCSHIPVIGVNMGTLGFLAEFTVDELKKNFDRIFDGEPKIEKRMMINCSQTRSSKQVFSSTAANDVFINAGPPFKVVELKMFVDDQPLASMISDGLIISTPTGSTAYNLSAGGPILSGKIEALVITPICPHSLSFRPIVISAESCLEVYAVNVNQGTTVSVDGRHQTPFHRGDILHISRHEGNFLIVNNPTRTYWDTLASKLRWAERPKYQND